MAKKGPKAVLTLAVIARIAAHVRTGAQIDEAAAAVGVARSTLHSWLQRGRLPGESIERALVEAVEEAQGKHAVRCHGTIARHAGKVWKAAQASLQLSNASRYGQGRIEFKVTNELQAALARLRDEFADEPTVYERILACLAGDSGLGGTPIVPAGAGGDADPQAGAVDSAPTEPGAVGVPRPLV